MTKNRLKKISKIAIWTGLAIITIGFTFDIFFAGLPNQEAPPEIDDPYNSRSAIADSLMFAGFIVFLAGLLLYSYFKWVFKKDG